MKLINEIVQTEIIDKLDNVLTIKSVDPAGGGTQKVYFCCIKWLKLYKTITSGDYTYLVDGVNGNSVKLIIPTGAPALTIFDEPTLNRPLLLNGTMLNASQEWTKSTLSEPEKLPFIWLASPTLERLDPLDSGIEKTSDLKLFFVHWSDWTQLNANRQADAVKPLMELVSAFRDAIDQNTTAFESYDGVDLRDYPKFGTMTDKGVDKTIFPSTLSAVEFDISLKLFRKYCEKC